MLDTTDLPVQYSVNCAELAELPAGLILNEFPPSDQDEPDEPDPFWPVPE